MAHKTEQASPAAKTALLYITIGALLVVWTTIWYYYMQSHRDPEAETSDVPFYICTGLLATGGILLAIGFGIGWIGRTARAADDAGEKGARPAAAAPQPPPAPQPMPAPGPVVPTQQVITPLPNAPPPPGTPGPYGS
jgi:hypothetical protein